MVSTELEKISSCKMRLKIDMPAAEVDEIRKKQEKEVQKNAQIQGFRKGKAPAQMVKSVYAGTIEKNTLDQAMQVALKKAIENENLNPVGYPAITKIDFDDDKNLKLQVEVEIFPEIQPKKYKNLSFVKNVYKIDEKDVDNNIEHIRKQKALITPVEEGAENGHYVTFSAQELDETGMPLIGKKYDDLRIQLGKGQFDSELESQISGMKAGEERRIEKRYPKSAGKELAGKVDRFNINMQKIELEELPEIDDEFVKELNLELNSVPELRQKVKEELENQWGHESEQEFYHHVVQELLHENPFDVPEAIIENYLDRIIEDISKRDKKFNEEEVRKHYHADATFNIKWYHLKQKIAELENITVTEEDFQSFLQNLNDEKARKLYESNQELKQRIMTDIFEKKVFDYIIKNSKVKEKKQSIKKRKDVGNV